MSGRLRRALERCKTPHKVLYFQLNMCKIFDMSWCEHVEISGIKLQLHIVIGAKNWAYLYIEYEATAENILVVVDHHAASATIHIKSKKIG